MYCFLGIFFRLVCTVAGKKRAISICTIILSLYVIMIICNCLGWKSRDSVPQLVEDYLGKKVKVDEFVSHTFSLADINQAFEVMHQGKR